MKKVWLIIAATALVLSGCLQTETKIKVDRGGAGFIERTLVMRSDVIEMMKGMQAFDTTKKGDGIFDERKLREDAKILGEGVKFESAAPIKNKLGEGYKVVYSFKDISKVRINQTPGNDLPTSGMGPEGSGGSDEFVTFEFRKGNPAELSILLYQNAEEESVEEEDSEETGEGADPAMDAEMMKQFYGDMRLQLTVETAGPVVDSDAEYRSGSTITLMDMDFNALMKNPEALETLTQNKIKTLEEMKDFSRKYPGIRLETKEKIRVKFR